MKKITQLITLFLLAVFCCSLLTSTAFAAETNSSAKIDYMNYKFPEGAEIIYQSPDGVIYTTDSSNNENSLTRSVEYNQVWIDAGKSDLGTFSVTNPHPLYGDGFGRLRLESNASEVQMNVTVSAGAAAFASTIIGVGKDVTFDFNTFADELIVHYSVVTKSNTHGMRLNCWLS